MRPSSLPSSSRQSAFSRQSDTIMQSQQECGGKVDDEVLTYFRLPPDKEVTLCRIRDFCPGTRPRILTQSGRQDDSVESDFRESLPSRLQLRMSSQLIRCNGGPQGKVLAFWWKEAAACHCMKGKLNCPFISRTLNPNKSPDIKSDLEEPYIVACWCPPSTGHIICEGLCGEG